MPFQKLHTWVSFRPSVCAMLLCAWSTHYGPSKVGMAQKIVQNGWRRGYGYTLMSCRPVSFGGNDP